MTILLLASNFPHPFESLLHCILIAVAGLMISVLVIIAFVAILIKRDDSTHQARREKSNDFSRSRAEHDV